MELNQIYTTENDLIGTKASFRVKDGKWISRSIGICAGMSLLWCKNVIDGKEGDDTKPGYSQAALLQKIYEMNGNNTKGLEKIYELLGLLVAQKKLDQPSVSVISRIKLNSGLYQLLIPNHSMAVCVDVKSIAKKRFDFFDPDEGLFRFDNFADFKQKLETDFAFCLGKDWGWIKFSSPAT